MRALKRGNNLGKCLLIGARNAHAFATWSRHFRSCTSAQNLILCLHFTPLCVTMLPMSQTIELPVETVARPSQAMPQWAVRLHNDNKNEMVFVVTALVN